MIPPSQFSRWIYENKDIWQLDFMNPNNLASLNKDRKVGFWENHIIHLWQLGWVRSDIVHGSIDSPIEGFEILEKRADGDLLFTDNRILGQVQVKVEEPISELVAKIPNIVPYFHPFKYFVFWHIQQVMKIIIHPYQMMIPKRYHEMLDDDIKFFYKWAQGEEAKDQINRWDEITRLAVLTEPCFYPQIIGSIKYPPQITYEQQKSRIDAYKIKLKDFYLEIGILSIKEMLQDLCISAEMIEPNKEIHSLMRFIKGSERQKLKGHLGGAVLLKTMAECIRRMAEYSYEIQLPEEDELGFGMWNIYGRERLYGSRRIFDVQGLLTKRQFVRELGLDSEVRLRIYVEGPTEYAAFRHILESWQQIEVFDLSGQFIQGKRKGLAFRDNLLLDDRSGVFSVIVLDGDRDDNIRIVRKAAEEDLFCGQFYISQPDFEFCNFSKDELTEIIWELVDDVQKSEELYQSLREAINSVSNAEELIKAVRKVIPSLAQFAKGNEWGETLAEFATKKPELEDCETVRPFIDACQTAIWSIGVDYLYNKTDFRVDPDSGKLVHR